MIKGERVHCLVRFRIGDAGLREVLVIVKYVLQLVKFL